MRSDAWMWIAVLLTGVASCGRGGVPVDQTARDRIWTLEQNLAEQVVPILRGLLGPDGLRVEWDGRGNQVLATGPALLVERAGEMIRNLDFAIYACGDAGHVYRLKHRSVTELLPIARSVATYLAAVRACDPYTPNYPALVIHADVEGNCFAMLGPYRDFQAIIELVDMLDVEPDPPPTPKEKPRKT